MKIREAYFESTIGKFIIVMESEQSTIKPVWKDKFIPWNQKSILQKFFSTVKYTFTGR